MKPAISDPLRRTILVGFVLSAIGFPIQIIGDWNYPPLPTGMLITLAGGLVAVLPFRWVPALPLLVGAFLIFGFVATGDFANMTGSDNVAVTVGKWLQFVALLVGTVAAVMSLVRPPARRPAATGS